MITSKLPRASAVLGVMARLAGDGGPGVRFAVIQHEIGVRVGGVATDIAKAMGLATTEMRMSMLTGGEMADGTRAREIQDKRLGAMGDGFVLLTDCDATPERTLRDTVEMLRLQDTDRDDEPRTLLVLMTTTRNIDRMRDAVVQATGRSTVAFDVVK